MLYSFGLFFFFFQAEDGIRDRSPSRGLGDVYKRQPIFTLPSFHIYRPQSHATDMCLSLYLKYYPFHGYFAIFQMKIKKVLQQVLPFEKLCRSTNRGNRI